MYVPVIDQARCGAIENYSVNSIPKRPRLGLEPNASSVLKIDAGLAHCGSTVHYPLRGSNRVSPDIAR